MIIIDEIADFLEHAKERGDKPLLVIVGPIAGGKSEFAIRLSEKFDGEIVSANANQIYKYLDIGTNKIHPSRRKNITHHLIDIVEPNREFSVAEYQRAASNAVTSITRRKKLPILCGGTALYINVIVDESVKHGYAPYIIGIEWNPETQAQLINDSVDEQMEKGFLNEVKTLLMKGYNAKMPSLTSLGYMELIQFLEGHVTLDEAIENIKRNTKNYSKTQMGLFKRDHNIHWVSGEELKIMN